MTYCLALRLDEGLVFLSDTRTNAGVDNVGNYRKLHVLRPGSDRVFVLHAFQKKSKSGIATPKADIELIRQRLKLAIEIAKKKE